MFLDSLIHEVDHLIHTRTVKNSFIITINSVIIALLGIGAIYFLTRILPPAEFGIYSFFIAVINLAAVLFQNAFSPIMVRFIGQYSRKNKSKLGLVIKVLAKWNFVQIFVISALGIFFSKTIALEVFGKPELYTPLIFSFITVLFLSFSYFYLGYLRANEKFKSYVVQSLLLKGIPLFLLIVFSLFKLMNVNVIFMIYGINTLFVFLLSLFLIPKSFVHAKGNQKSMFKEMFSFGRWMFLASTFYNLAKRVPVFFVAYFLSLAEVGIFSVANQLVVGVFLFLLGFQTVLLPKAAKLINKKERVSFVKKAFTILSGLSIFIYLGFLLFSYKVIPLVLGEKYVSAIGVFLIILPAYLLDFVITPLKMCVVQSLGDPKPLVLLRILTFSLSLPIYIYVTPIFGIFGLAYVLLGESIVYTLIVGTYSFIRIFKE